MTPDKLPPRRLTNLVWYWLSRGADEKGRARLEASLLRPLPGRVTRVSAGVIDYERSLFLRSMASQAGG